MKAKIALCLLGVISLGVGIVQAQATRCLCRKNCDCGGGSVDTIGKRTNNPELAAPLIADKFMFHVDTDGSISGRTEISGERQKATKFAQRNRHPGVCSHGQWEHRDRHDDISERKEQTRPANRWTSTRVGRIRG